MLEMHYLAKKFNNGNEGLGPFVAVQPGGTSQIISSVGAGLLWDWKISSGGNSTTTTTDSNGKQKTTKSSTPNTSRKGFGLGFGYASIPAAKTLGDEFVPNTPAPTSGGKPLPIRFETRDKGSLMLLLSFTF
jgi:hypothetical protein